MANRWVYLVVDDDRVEDAAAGVRTELKKVNADSGPAIGRRRDLVVDGDGVVDGLDVGGGAGGPGDVRRTEERRLVGADPVVTAAGRRAGDLRPMSPTPAVPGWAREPGPNLTGNSLALELNGS